MAGHGPSARLIAEADGGLTVVEGLAKFVDDGWETPQQVPLTDFLRWVFAGKVLPHLPLAPLRHPLRQLEQVWTAECHATAENAYLEKVKKRQRNQQENRAAHQLKPEDNPANIRAKNAASRDLALFMAKCVEEKAKQLHVNAGSKLYEKLTNRPDVQLAVAFLDIEYGISATVGWSHAAAHWAGGVPLIDCDEQIFVAVLDPDPGQVNGAALALLTDMLLLFPTAENEQRFERNIKGRRMVPIDGLGTECLEDPGMKGSGRKATGEYDCGEPRPS